MVKQGCNGMQLPSDDDTWTLCNDVREALDKAKGLPMNLKPDERFVPEMLVGHLMSFFNLPLQESPSSKRSERWRGMEEETSGMIRLQYEEMVE